MSEKNIITINSAVLYVLAFLLTTIIHEFMHAIIGSSFGSNPILHHNYVEHLSVENLTINQKVTVALAGPLISLTQGILSAIAYIKIRYIPHRLIHLFLLWFSVLGLFNFLGYLMTGFIFKAGDIGKSYNLLNAPFWIQILLAITAATCFVSVAYKITTPYLRFSYHEKWLNDGKSRKNFSFHTLFLPWIIGSCVITILYLPIIALISIIYPILSGMIFIFPWQNAEGIKNVEISTNQEIGKLSYKWIVLLIIFVIVFRFILKPGIEI